MLAAFGGICKHALVLDKEAVKSGFCARLLTRGESSPDESQASRWRVQESPPCEFIIEKFLSSDIEPIYHSMDKTELHK